MLSPTAIPGSSRRKGVSQEFEPDMFVFSAPFRVLAGDDFRLPWLNFQAALRQRVAKGLKQRFRLSPSRGVQEHIIRIALEQNLRIIPLHPLVERIVQKQFLEVRPNAIGLASRCGSTVFIRATRPCRFLPVSLSESCQRAETD